MEALTTADVIASALDLVTNPAIWPYMTAALLAGVGGAIIRVVKRFAK